MSAHLSMVESGDGELFPYVRIPYDDETQSEQKARTIGAWLRAKLLSQGIHAEEIKTPIAAAGALAAPIAAFLDFKP